MTVEQKNKKRIQNIIKNCYKQSTQSLCLGLYYFIIDGYYTDWFNILQQKDWNSLQNLSLCDCRINDYEISNLNNHQWPNLLQLRLSENMISQYGLQQLLNNQWINKLQSLSLSWNNIGNNGFKKLCNKIFKSIKYLFSISNKISGLALQIILQYKFEKLSILNLYYNQVGNKGSKYLSKAEFLQLQQLWLNNCEIGDEGIKYLTKSRWPKFKILCIDNNKYKFQGYFYLAKNYWKQIDQINVIFQPISLLQLLTQKNKVRVKANKKIQTNKQFFTDLSVLMQRLTN